MKLVLVPLFFILLSINSHAQSLKKYPISNTGCSIYSFCKFEKFDSDYSEDSSKVITTECSKDDITYGVICIQLLNPIPNKEDAEGAMISYLDYLKLNFNITGAAGYGKGHTMANYDKAIGIIDYWTDNKKNNWKVKGWTDGIFITVVYAYSAKEIPDTKVNVFLDGFRFPGM